MIAVETAAEMQLADERRAYRVVIGLPVFNGARHLARALESLLVQSFDEFILVVVDNCSTDATPEIVQRYAALDSRIFY